MVSSSSHRLLHRHEDLQLPDLGHALLARVPKDDGGLRLGAQRSVGMWQEGCPQNVMFCWFIKHYKL